MFYLISCHPCSSLCYGMKESNEYSLYSLCGIGNYLLWFAWRMGWPFVCIQDDDLLYLLLQSAKRVQWDKQFHIVIWSVYTQARCAGARKGRRGYAWSAILTFFCLRIVINEGKRIVMLHGQNGLISKLVLSSGAFSLVDRYYLVDGCCRDSIGNHTWD
jgi:hypothetical protein